MGWCLKCPEAPLPLSPLAGADGSVTHTSKCNAQGDVHLVLRWLTKCNILYWASKFNIIAGAAGGREGGAHQERQV